MANLRCLAVLQKRTNLQKFPNIAKALASRLPAVYKRYHDKRVRDRLKEGVEKHVKSGDLVKIAALLDSPDVQEKDFLGFRRAMQEYADLRQEKTELELQLEEEGKFGRSTGKEFAALVSGCIAIIVMLVTTYMFFVDKGF